ncbi:MAG: surface/cell-adhesion protein, partial [Clostridia bacterium]|nr:surface/cell-adhesion protein [Clostridia bacterium]
MKHKIFACLLCVLILVSSLGGLSASAEASKSAEDEVREIFDGILTYHKVDSIQAWIDGGLTQKAGVSAEWYLLALSQYGDYDFASYEGALLDYLADQEIYAASTRQKYALCLISTGSTNGYISAVLGGSIGKQGIMSYVYGLHLLNNGYVSKEFTTNMVIEKLLSLQCEDGGWSLTGKAGDVDVTAMTVQALALHYDE